MGESGIEILSELFKKEWNTGTIPKDWEANLWETITLFDMPAKVYEKVIESKL